MPGRGGVLHRAVLGLGIVALGSLSVWGYVNRDRIAAACLTTVDGVTSKLAHLNSPFGLGSSVESKNPILGIVPDFVLTASTGKEVKKADMLGGYWVASFIFTRCATTCPMAVTELAALQTKLPQEVRLVSFTVDPENDSPEVLAEYAKRVGADVDRWLFLTGDKNLMYTYIREGFHLAVEQNFDGPAGWEVTHTPRFALVDPKGRIRGYYDSSDPEDLLRLQSDLDRLMGRTPQEASS